MSSARSTKRHWEDIEIGRPHLYGDYLVTKDAIFEFAREYDPQPHHVDEEAAMLSLTKGLCASGWHTCAIFMRMFYDGVLVDCASLGGPAIDEIKWMKPVRPGHVLSARSTCVDKRLLKSRPSVGMCRMRHEISNQHGELLMIMENPFFIAVRDPAGAAAGAAR